MRRAELGQLVEIALVATETEVDEIVGILGDVLGEAQRRMLGRYVARAPQK